MVDTTLGYLDDLEIYVATKDLATIQRWLDQSFDQFKVVRTNKKGFKFNCEFKTQTNHGLVHLNAGNTGFTSIWIDGKHTPWDDDVAMARSAFQAFGVSVRSIESAWSNGDDPDQWLEISDQGEAIIQWVTNND